MLFGGALLSVFFVFLLYVLSISDKKNGFNRVFFTLPHNAYLVDIKYRNYYIAGLNKQSIFLANSIAPDHMLVVNYNLTDIQQVNLGIPSEDSLAWGALKVVVDYPNVYVSEGITPNILKCSLLNFKWTKSQWDSAHFIDALPLTPASFIIRAYDNTSLQNILAKQVLQPVAKMIRAPKILEKQKDGIFCTDGMLIRDSQLGVLVYVYYYRNQFIVMDTSLNVMARHKTIDTVSHVQIDVGKIESENRITLASPSRLVNKRSAVYGNLLFIHSGLKADNERDDLFHESSAVDVYFLKSGEYIKSFYLPKFNGKRMHDFKIFENKLVALHDHYILVYDLGDELKI